LWRGLLGFFVGLNDLDILDITASKDNVLIFLLGGREEGFDFSIFGAKAEDIFEGEGGLFGVYLM
jgi:hypothetical protein